jgi:hypothetical protein
MGLEARCTARAARRSSDGRARLEATELRFRGDFRLDIPFARMRAVSARDGVLRIETAEGTVALELGPAAGKWADRILNPKPVIEKLGVKPGQTVSILGLEDAAFLKQVRARAGVVATDRARPGSDLVFLAAEGRGALSRLATLRRALHPAGAIWAVWRKGQEALKEGDVRAAALAAGLVDVKVVSFSPTHSALKLVIPRARR